MYCDAEHLSFTTQFFDRVSVRHGTADGMHDEKTDSLYAKNTQMKKNHWLFSRHHHHDFTMILLEYDRSGNHVFAPRLSWLNKLGRDLSARQVFRKSGESNTSKVATSISGCVSMFLVFPRCCITRIGIEETKQLKNLAILAALLVIPINK